MELFAEIKSEKTLSTYPPVYWGIREEYGLTSALLVLIERDPNIQNNLYPHDNTNKKSKHAQCKEIAKVLFINIPEINFHLGNPDGLHHYATTIMMRLRRLAHSFLKVILTMPRFSNWPDRDQIRMLCPSFNRLAPLLWSSMKSRKTFNPRDVSVAIERTHLEFCSAITLYDPERAAAQIAAQDAVLRQLQDPYRVYHDLGITVSGPYPNNPIRYRRLHKHPTKYDSPRQGSTALLAPKILSVADSHASQSSEHEPKTYRHNSVSDSTVLLAQQIPQYDGTRVRNGALQSPQHKKRAAPEIITGDLGKKREQLDKSELRDILLFCNQRGPQANCVPQTELKLVGLGSKTTDSERIGIGLVGGNRMGCPSQQDQEDATVEVHLAKKQRRHERFEEPKPKTLPPQNISRVSSSKLFVARLEQAARLDQQKGHERKQSAWPPHQDEQEPARNFPTVSPAQVHTIDEALSSTHSPRFFKEEEGEQDVGVVSSWKELDKVRLSMWRRDAEVIPDRIPDLNTVIKDESGRNDTIGFIKREPLEEQGT